MGTQNERGFIVKENEDYVGIDSYNRPSGAYVLASFLRKQGYSVVVMTNFSKLSFAGLKDFINRNSKDLLWVGISTTFYYTRNPGLHDYRKQWADLNDFFCDRTNLYKISSDKSRPIELLLGRHEVNLLADYLKETYANVPLLFGGAWVTHVKNGNLYNLRDNVYIVTGNAENYVKTISHELKEKKSDSLILKISNTNYDDHEFKKSSITYTNRDYISPDEWLPIEISRGCAFNCAYCVYDRKSVHDNYKDTEFLRNELIENYEKFGVTKYLLLDDLYNDKHQLA
jgi:hypothetical protein